MKPFAAVSAAAVVAAVATPAFAQVEISTRLSAPVVEQDQPFRLQLRVSLQGGGATPENPRLQVPNGIRVQGPSLAPETRVTIVNGRMMQSSGLTATWILVAPKPGKYRLGPPSIEIGGRLERGEVKTVEVVAPGTLRRGIGGIPGRPPFDPFDFFDPFGAFPRLPFQLDEPEAEPQAPSFPPEFAVERAPDPVAFVVGKVDSARVVVGQAVRLGVYAYGGRGAYQIEMATEPSRAGFLAYADSVEPNVYSVPIGDQAFLSRKIYSLVLFPLETGTLRIGPTRIGFSGRNYPGSPPSGLLMRETEPVDVVVVEPPMNGRPPGYRLGDVGQFKLTATVDPKKVRQGEAVSVIAKLEGTGNLPAKLNVPLQSGVDWQDPTSIDKSEAIEGALRGERIFTYVVQLNQPGIVELGELSLPFYDPTQGRYIVAKAALGSVEVTPTPGASPKASSAPVAEDRLRGVLAPRRTLRKIEAPARPLTDQPGFWWLLALGPVGVLTTSGAVRAASALLARKRARRETPAEHAERELVAAQTAKNRGEPALVAAAVERAVHHAIEAATGLKSRGILRRDLSSELQSRGLSSEFAERAARLLEHTENARFAGSDASLTADLVEEAREFVRSALRVRRA